MAFFEYGERETSYLKSVDPSMEKVIGHYGHIQRETEPDLFSALIKSIVAQQISTKAAQTVSARLFERFQGLDPKEIFNAKQEDIQQCGLSFRKAGYIKGIASAVCDGSLDLLKLKDMDDKEVINVLSALNGIGIWTAEMLLIFSLNRKNIFSFGDFALKNGLKKLYKLDGISSKDFDAYRYLFSPYCSVASLYLWRISGDKDFD